MLLILFTTPPNDIVYNARARIYATYDNTAEPYMFDYNTSSK